MTLGPESHGGADNPQNFYKPITSVLTLNWKLESILRKPIISDEVLFETIADMFSICQKQNDRSGQLIVIDGSVQGIDFGDAEISIEDPDSKEPVPFSDSISFCYEKLSSKDQTQRQESVRLEFCDGNNDSGVPSLTVRLDRGRDGTIKDSSFVVGEDGEEKRAPVEDKIRKRIIEILLGGTKLKRASNVIYLNKN
jgi:hypothetical protein